MADEYERQDNPDPVPGDVSSGYQAQNTNSEISRNGIDLSVINPGAIDGDVDIEVSGGVDVNGLLYSCKTISTLTIPSGIYYIKLDAGSSVGFLTPVFQTGDGSFDDQKNARYDAGERILNWVLVSDGGVNAVKCYKRWEHKFEAPEVRVENFISFTKDNNSSSGGVYTDMYSYQNAQSTTSSILNKNLEITYDFTGTVNLLATVGSNGSTGTRTVAIYKNGVSAGISGTGTGTVSASGNVSIVPGDLLQVYISTTTPGTPAFNPSLTVRYRDIWGTYKKGTIIL